MTAGPVLAAGPEGVDLVRVHTAVGGDVGEGCARPAGGGMQSRGRQAGCGVEVVVVFTI